MGHARHGTARRPNLTSPLLLFYTSLLSPFGSQTPICYPNQYPHQRCAKIKRPWRPPFPFPDSNPSLSPRPAPPDPHSPCPPPPPPPPPPTPPAITSLPTSLPPSPPPPSPTSASRSAGGPYPLLLRQDRRRHQQLPLPSPLLLRRLALLPSLHRCCSVRRPFCGNPTALPARLTALCRSHHIIIARLLGTSLSDDDLYLVYEYVLSATLADCLRNPSFSSLSSWLSHVQVAADLAQGLEYIHHYSASTGLHSPR